MQYEFEVKGMTCGHCERAVTQAVHSVDSAAKVLIDRSANKVVIESSADGNTLKTAITDEGYEVMA